MKYKPSKAENKPETEATSSLLTPDDNDRTTATPLPATLPQDVSTTASTPVVAGSKVTITMPSTLMSPESPMVTTSTEPVNTTTTTVQSQSSVAMSAAEGTSTTDVNTATETTEKVDTEPKSVADVSNGSVKIVENNNEEIVEDENEKENKETTNVQDAGKSTENEGKKFEACMDFKNLQIERLLQFCLWYMYNCKFSKLDTYTAHPFSCQISLVVSWIMLVPYTYMHITQDLILKINISILKSKLKLLSLSLELYLRKTIRPTTSCDFNRIFQDKNTL